MSPTDGHPLPQARLVLRGSLARTLCGAHGAVFRPPAKARHVSSQCWSCRAVSGSGAGRNGQAPLSAWPWSLPNDTDIG